MIRVAPSVVTAFHPVPIVPLMRSTSVGGVDGVATLPPCTVPLLRSRSAPGAVLGGSFKGNVWIPKELRAVNWEEVSAAVRVTAEIGFTQLRVASAKRRLLSAEDHAELRESFDRLKCESAAPADKNEGGGEGGVEGGVNDDEE